MYPGRPPTEPGIFLEDLGDDLFSTKIRRRIIQRSSLTALERMLEAKSMEAEDGLHTAENVLRGMLAEWGAGVGLDEAVECGG